MSICKSTITSNMASFLLLVATILLVVVEASPSSRFAFHNAVESNASSPKRAFLALSVLQKQELAKMLSVRGGAEEDEEADDESEESDEEEDESEDEYYDDESEEEEEEADSLVSGLKKKSDEKETSTEYVEPYFVSPSLQMYTTFGTILLSRKIDMFNPTVVRLVRTLFILYLLIQQAFIFYVRIMAKKNNNRTPVQVENPLSSMLNSQLEKQGAGGNDMVKNMASSFLKTESTVLEYDMSQARNMQGGILFNMILMWFMHFKLQQVQPLLVTSINGFLQLVYNPLFQVYVMGRNLERPFKSPAVLKPPTEDSEVENKGEEEGTGKAMVGDDATETATDGKIDEAEKDEEESDDEEDESDEDVEEEDEDDEDSE